MSISTITKNRKLFISQHFDSLIREVDLFIEERLPADEKQLEMKIRVIYYDEREITEEKRKPISEQIDTVFDFEAIEDFGQHAYKKVWNYFKMSDFNFNRNLWIYKEAKIMKLGDYLNEFRNELIAELNQFQSEAFQKYEKIRDELRGENSLNKDIENILPRVFDKFVFIVKYNDLNKVMRLIELDFYLNPYECQLLK